MYPSPAPEKYLYISLLPPIFTTMHLCIILNTYWTPLHMIGLHVLVYMATCLGHLPITALWITLLEDILNINLPESQWLQSTLDPIGMGGLGRRVSSLVLPAFWHQPWALGSGHPRAPVKSPKKLGSLPDQHLEYLLAMWLGFGINTNIDFPTHIQSKWDKPLLQKTFSELCIVVYPLTKKHDQTRYYQGLENTFKKYFENRK